MLELCAVHDVILSGNWHFNNRDCSTIISQQAIAASLALCWFMSNILALIIVGICVAVTQPALGPQCHMPFDGRSSMNSILYPDSLITSSFLDMSTLPQKREPQNCFLIFIGKSCFGRGGYCLTFRHPQTIWYDRTALRARPYHFLGEKSIPPACANWYLMPYALFTPQN